MLGGRLDILVNNAAICEPAALHEITGDHFDRMVAANVKSVLFAS